MRHDDRAYYEERAEAELTAAAASGHPAAVRAHYLLAGFYLDLVHRPGDGGDERRNPPAGREPFILG
jgi:hypothetical protein